jgi:hypothetical protein
MMHKKIILKGRFATPEDIEAQIEREKLAASMRYPLNGPHRSGQIVADAPSRIVGAKLKVRE